jgi:hypothetical protein
MAGRYAHAKQFNRHRRQLRLLRTRLGRIIRDIPRNIGGKALILRPCSSGHSRAGQSDPLSAAAPARHAYLGGGALFAAAHPEFR